MNRAAVYIPEKLFFKIGEVCEIVGVQAHVLRYWESEFPMLAPQKNRAGQRTYRKRDVEMALRIKELLYDELYTIAGAKKRLQQDIRGASKLKVVTPEMAAAATSATTVEDERPAPAAEARIEAAPNAAPFRVPYVESEPPREPAFREQSSDAALSDSQRRALKRLYMELQELLKVLEAREPAPPRR